MGPWPASKKPLLNQWPFLSPNPAAGSGRIESMENVQENQSSATRASDIPLRMRLIWKVKRARRKALFFVFRTVVFPLSYLPLSALRRVGIAAGWIGFHLLSRPRKTASENLKIAFGDEATPTFRRNVVRRMFCGFGRIMGESVAFDRLGQDRVNELVLGSSGFEHVERLMAEGRGGVIATPHFGNFELFASWCFLRSDGVVIERRSKGSPFTAYIRRRRDRLGLKTVDQASSPRHLLRTLTSGNFIGVLPDQDMDTLAGMFVPFFEKDAFTTTAPAFLARSAKVPIVPAFMIWDGHGYHACFKPPLEVPRTGDKVADLLQGTRAWSKVFESVIREHPEQWAWIHKRWKTTPAGLQEKKDRRRKRARAEEAKKPRQAVKPKAVGELRNG